MVESSQVRDRVKEQQTDSQRRIRVCSRLRERSHLSTTEAWRAKARAECSWRQGSSDRSGCCSLATARATQSITHWYLMQRETPQGPVQNRSCIVQGLCCFCSFEELLPRCEDTSKTPPGHFLSARIGFVAGCPVQMKFRFWNGGLEEEALAWVWVDAQLACALPKGRRVQPRGRRSLHFPSQTAAAGTAITQYRCSPQQRLDAPVAF